MNFPNNETMYEPNAAGSIAPPEVGRIVKEERTNWKFPLIAFFLSLFAWFPKTQVSLNPLFFIPVGTRVTNEVGQLKSPLTAAFNYQNLPHVLVYSHDHDNYSIYTLNTGVTSCTCAKLEILPEPIFVRSITSTNLGIQSPPSFIKSFQPCKIDETSADNRKNPCDPYFIVISSLDYKVTVITPSFRKVYSFDLGQTIGHNTKGCDVQDLAVLFEVHQKIGTIFVKFKQRSKKDVGSNSQDADMVACEISDSFVLKFDMWSGKIKQVKQFNDKTSYHGWSLYSGSVHGMIHSWHKWSDTLIEPKTILSNQQLLISEEAGAVTMSNQPSIRDFYHSTSKTIRSPDSRDQSLDNTVLEKHNHNTYCILYSEGILIIDWKTLEPVTLITLPNSPKNNSIHIIWDEEIRSISSVDVGSSLKTIGIPRIFAESRVQGQTQPIFQKLLSVQDLVGMTIDESLEDLRFLQPPISFFSEKASKFDQLGVLLVRSTSSIGPKFMFHIGYGTVKSYDLEGNLVWKSESSGKWQSNLKYIKSNPIIENSFTPFIAKVDSINAIFIQGLDHISLLSQLNGAEISSHTLPSYPISPPIVLDFNDDKTDDVIVVTSQGLVGFSMCSTFSNAQICVFYIAAILTFGLFVLGTNIHKFSVD